MLYRLIVAAIVILFATDAHAQVQGWNKSPSIVILGAANDPRVPLVLDAVAFWNGIFEEIETPFRLGKVTIAQSSIPNAELRKLSELTMGGLAGKFPIPDGVRTDAGDLVIALSDIDFVSFATRWMNEAKGMIAIKSHRAKPFDQPNVMRNVIAHEIGHAIGLFHNADPAMLMCGRPADCRPDSFISQETRYFPLTSQDRNNLKRMYPVDWAAQ